MYLVIETPDQWGRYCGKMRYKEFTNIEKLLKYVDKWLHNNYPDNEDCYTECLIALEDYCYYVLDEHRLMIEREY
jgi:hypothetical protein